MRKRGNGGRGGTEEEGEGERGGGERTGGDGRREVGAGVGVGEEREEKRVPARPA